MACCSKAMLFPELAAPDVYLVTGLRVELNLNRVFFSSNRKPEYTDHHSLCPYKE